MKNIRNFCIIAHIDHGKSTLADRLLEYTHTISKRDMQEQALDNMDLERERGITIKSHAIQMHYIHPANGEEYIFNLIDTPGHVDFSYEVSRSIAACEGALLLVDASQGIQAQTISNLYLAVDHDLEIIPIVNKVDMVSAMVEEVQDQIIDLIGCKREDIISASGRTGIGIAEILAGVVDRIPAPKGDPEAPLQTMIFDSVFNSYRGVIAYVRVMNGIMKKGDKLKFYNTGKEVFAEEVGVLRMGQFESAEIGAGGGVDIVVGNDDDRKAARGFADRFGDQDTGGEVGFDGKVNELAVPGGVGEGAYRNRGWRGGGEFRGAQCCEPIVRFQINSIFDFVLELGQPCGGWRLRLGGRGDGAGEAETGELAAFVGGHGVGQTSIPLGAAGEETAAADDLGDACWRTLRVANGV